LAEHSPPPAAPDLADRDLYPEARRRFREALRAAGFEPVPRDDEIERWDGAIDARWHDDATGEDRQATHKVRVVLYPGFPFRKPIAYKQDAPSVAPQGRHAVVSPGGELCLYPETYRGDTQRGWAAWRTGDEYIARLHEFFEHMYRDDWSDDDRPADLHLFFPKDGTPGMVSISDGWSPPRSSRSGRFGVWELTEKLIFADHPAEQAGSVPSGPTTDRIVRLLPGTAEHRARVGAWFRLDREPLPRKNLGGLLAELDRAAGAETGWSAGECRQLIGATSDRGRPPLLALGYPNPAGRDGESWLFLEGLPEMGAPIRWKDPSTYAKVAIRAWETVRVDRTALMRRVGPLASAVSGRTVLIFGVGALGGSVALQLARSGVEQLILVDSDRLRPGNVARHIAGLSSTGVLKIIAMSIIIAQHAPDASVDIEIATWDPVAVRALVERADVVVDATADPEYNLLLNAVCVRAGRPLVQAETMRRAAVGRVRVVRPGRDACLLCYAEHSQAQTYPLVPPGEGEEFFEEGCGVPTMEAPAVDIDTTANWTARLVLWLLRDSLGPRNHLLVVNDEVPGLTGDLGIVGVHWGVYGPVPECEECGRQQLRVEDVHADDLAPSADV